MNGQGTSTASVSADEAISGHGANTAATAKARSRKRVMAADVKNKSCWICSEEEDDDDAAAASSHSTSTPHVRNLLGGKERTRRFVHACGCTLVAHEACLLAWIEQCRIKQTNSRTPIKCPQCQVPYKILENKPLILSAFEVIDDTVQWALPFTCAGIVLGSVVFVTTAYGLVAIRLFMGKEASRRLLAKPWPWHFWVDIPCIPVGLIGAKLRIFDSLCFWFPTLSVLPFLQAPMMLTARLLHREHGLEWQLGPLPWREGRRWPPSPSVTLLLAPWFRSLYLALKRTVYAYVWRSVKGKHKNRRQQQQRRLEAGPQQEQPAEPPTPGADAEPDRRVLVLGQRAENDLLRAPDPPPGVDAIREELVPAAPRPQEQGHYHEDGDSSDEEEGGNDPQRRAAMRMLYDEQRAPRRDDAANQARLRRDNALAELQQAARELEQVAAELGADAPARNAPGGNAPAPAAAAAAAPVAGPPAPRAQADQDAPPAELELQRTVYISPRSIGQLCIGALALPGISAVMGNVMKLFARRSKLLARFLGLLPAHFASGSATAGLKGSSGLARLWSNSPSAGSTTAPSSAALWNPLTSFDDLEPVWWRNAVGLAFYIVVKDLGVLLYRFMKVRQRGFKSIKDIPFDPKQVEGLELKETRQ